ncbi:ATP-binding cassette domain-containing protein [Marinifilum sp. N1E240]|uniref:ABC transporter ATP-binding protein n=1 Tax=Marinifilum sp. N1E240 TaxID=2608082 RepID=UPI00128DB41E|nr:ABC transporter ATP-binding protein [Marinifilum sp. N1E240]MPQ48964.1 ATP-binding cassette domain-containing protein [Marinifilum sp. N1E240]
MELIIENLTKTYNNGVKALNDVNIKIGTGMFGLLGPNGAGKSTLMRTIATLQEGDGGRILFDGIDIMDNKMALRNSLGYLPQSFGVYPKMSAEDLLMHFAELKGISNKQERKNIVEAVLEQTNLIEARKKNVAGYSGGMKQRFGIAQLLLNNPKLIIVDEPTAGLDPAERSRFLNVLREIGTNHIVIFSTHIVEDVKELCTDMAIMNGGTILTHETPRQSVEKLQGKMWTKRIERSALNEQKENFEILSSRFNDDNSMNINVHSETQPDEFFESKEADLEDVYFVTLKASN